MEALAKHLEIGGDLLRRLSFNLTGDTLEVVEIALAKRLEELLVVYERPFSEACSQLGLIAVLELLRHQIKRIDQFRDLLGQFLQRLEVIEELELVDLLQPD